MSKWKHGLRLEPCGACSRFDRLDEYDRAGYSRLIKFFEPHPGSEFDEDRLTSGEQLARAGMIPYNCFNCDDYGERWRTTTGRYYKMGQLPIRPDGMLDIPPEGVV